MTECFKPNTVLWALHMGGWSLMFLFSTNTAISETSSTQYSHLVVTMFCDDGTETVHVTPLSILAASPYLNVLVDFSKGLWAVKLCSNKILQFLTGVAG